MTTGSACERCGLEHDRCKAHNRAGKPCRLHPLTDQEVCKLHGGASPNAKAAAKTKAVERAAAAELARRWATGDELPVGDPLSELARLAGEAVAFKDYLRDQVNALDGVLTYWQEKDYLDGEGGIEWTKAAEDMRAVVSAYERAQDRCGRLLASIVKLDLAGRLLELRREQADMIAGAVREGLAAVDMPAEVRRGAQEAISEALTRMSSTPTAAEPRQLTA